MEKSLRLGHLASYGYTHQKLYIGGSRLGLALSYALLHDIKPLSIQTNKNRSLTHNNHFTTGEKASFGHLCARESRRQRRVKDPAQ